MNAKTFYLVEFLSNTQPFNTLPLEVLERVEKELEAIRYCLGDTILLPERIPTQVLIICRGQIRLLGRDPRNQKGRW